MCLLDTGRNTNLFGKHVFDRLPEELRGQLVESDTHGMMADGTPLYGVVELRIRLKELLIEKKLIVSRVSKYVILGMPFLANHRCTIDFNSGGWKTNRVHRPARKKADKFSTAHKTPETEMTLQCRVTP